MTIAHAAHPNTRESRALELAERAFEEIASSHRRGRYTVPASGGGSYTVYYTSREESCECPDWIIRGATCYHVLAVAVVHAKSGVCCECGRRARHRALHEVGADSLTFFEGDLVCEECAVAHGVL